MKETPDASDPLKPGAVIDQRFKVEAELADALGRGAFLVTDIESNEPKVAFQLTSESEREAARQLTKVNHAHLAKLLEVVDVGSTSVAIAERVEGETLVARLADVGKKEPVDAVRSCLRIADALSVAHEKGAHHGRVQPCAVVVTPDGRAGPILALGGPTSETSPYRCPQRGASGPSEDDDTWATTALLFEMLTGEPPPREGFESEAQLGEHGIPEALRDTLLNGLHSREEQRSQGLRPMKRDLARWFVEHAGEEPFIHPAMSSNPPPLPRASQSPSRNPASLRTSSVQPARKTRLPMLAAGGLVFGLGAAWAASSLLPGGETESPPSEAAPALSASAPASAEAIDLGDVDIAGESDTDMGANNKLSSCVASYLPKKSFEKAPNLGWVCSVESPRRGADKLRAAVVANSPGRQVSQAMQLFSRMGWYDVLAFATVRAGCCPEAQALALPNPSSGCDRMDTLAASIGRRVVDGQDFQAGLDKYTAAAKCEVQAGNGRTFKKAEPPGGGELEAFVEYTKGLK
jgi:serine/threonine protein kinase